MLNHRNKPKGIPTRNSKTFGRSISKLSREFHLRVNHGRSAHLERKKKLFRSCDRVRASSSRCVSMST